MAWQPSKLKPRSIFMLIIYIYKRSKLDQARIKWFGNPLSLPIRNIYEKHIT